MSHSPADDRSIRNARSDVDILVGLRACLFHESHKIDLASFCLGVKFSDTPIGQPLDQTINGRTFERSRHNRFDGSTQRLFWIE